MLENLYADWPRDPAREDFANLLQVPGLRIERIVSHGQASPAGFWYEQGWDEWVIVLQGEAHLQIEGRAGSLRLQAGDHCWLPAGCRHRVAATAADGPTLWLAVHRDAPQNPDVV